MEKFYNREQQLSELRAISAGIEQSKGQLSVVVGRRRVGKTRLLNEAFSQESELLSNLVYGIRPRSCLIDPVLVRHP